MEMDATSLLALSVAIDCDAPSALKSVTGELADLRAAVTSAGLTEDLRLPTGESVREMVRDYIETVSSFISEQTRYIQTLQGIEEALGTSRSYAELRDRVLAAITEPRPPPGP